MRHRAGQTATISPQEEPDQGDTVAFTLVNRLGPGWRWRTDA